MVTTESNWLLLIDYLNQVSLLYKTQAFEPEKETERMRADAVGNVEEKRVKAAPDLSQVHGCLSYWDRPGTTNAVWLRLNFWKITRSQSLLRPEAKTEWPG